jgi:uncharacterized protein (TIGR02145 family)
MIKWIILFFALFLSGIKVSAQWDDYVNMDDGSFIDDRDGQEYNWAKIGHQIWMTQNLNVGKIIYVIDSKITDKYSIEKLCYQDNNEYCRIYRGLYTNEVIEFYTPNEGARSICPEGWHLPSESEWLTLFNYLGGTEVAGGAMKEAGLTHWEKPNKGATNSSGFTALPAGLIAFNKDERIDTDLGKTCCFWSSTDWWPLAFIFHNYRTFCLKKNNAKISPDKTLGNSAHSVRCVKDD